MRWEIPTTSMNDTTSGTSFKTSRYKVMSWKDEKLINIMTQKAVSFLSPMLTSVYLPGSSMQKQYMQHGNYDVYTNIRKSN